MMANTLNRITDGTLFLISLVRPLQIAIENSNTIFTTFFMTRELNEIHKKFVKKQLKTLATSWFDWQKLLLWITEICMYLMLGFGFKL